MKVHIVQVIISDMQDRTGEPLAATIVELLEQAGLEPSMIKAQEIRSKAELEAAEKQFAPSRQVVLDA